MNGLAAAIRAGPSPLCGTVIEDWLGELTRDQATDKLNNIGVPAGPVQTAEDIFADPHLDARGMLMTISDPEVGDYRFARSPLHLSAAPELPKNPAPNLGQHTRSILISLLGYSDQQIDELVAESVVETLE